MFNICINCQDLIVIFCPSPDVISTNFGFYTNSCWLIINFYSESLQKCHIWWSEITIDFEFKKSDSWTRLKVPKFKVYQKVIWFLLEKVRLTKLYNIMWLIIRCDHYLRFYLLYLILLKNLFEYLVRESVL